jgi:hypothetical protein
MPTHLSASSRAARAEKRAALEASEEHQACLERRRRCEERAVRDEYVEYPLLSKCEQKLSPAPWLQRHRVF